MYSGALNFHFELRVVQTNEQNLFSCLWASKVAAQKERNLNFWASKRIIIVPLPLLLFPFLEWRLIHQSGSSFFRLASSWEWERKGEREREIWIKMCSLNKIKATAATTAARFAINLMMIRDVSRWNISCHQEACFKERMRERERKSSDNNNNKKDNQI